MMSLSPGTRVVDAVFGPGIIVRPTASGYLVVVDAVPSRQLERPAAALRAEGPVPTSSSAPGPAVPAHVRTQAGGDEPARARIAVDALRFGVVPASHIDDLTLGYDKLVDWVSANLPVGGTPARASAVYGTFGSGKSHTMAAIREIARRAGYLAMATEVDGVDITMAQPKELLASLLGHLTGTTTIDGAAPLLSLVQKAARSGRQSPTGNRSPALAEDVTTVMRLASTSKFDDLDDPIERLLGSDPALTRTDFKGIVRETLDWDDYVRLTYDRGYSPRPLISHSPVARRPTELVEALLGYASLARAAGCEGLVVTVDELEVQDQLTTAANREKVVEMVTALRAELFSRRPSAGGLGLFFAAVGQSGAIEDEVVKLIVEPNPNAPYVLRPWKSRDLLDLSRRIHDLYRRAYELAVDYDPTMAEGVFDFLDEDADARIRMFIRGYVARLDVAYGPPHG